LAVGQVPVHSGHRWGGRRSRFWGDYTDCPTDPAFRFGHGLSYTTFDYTDLSVEADTVAVRVTNTGARSGTDVVQLYATDDAATVARPERQLIGFARVDLAPGESRTARFTVHSSRLAFYDEQMRFVVEPGTFTMRVGELAAPFT